MYVWMYTYMYTGMYYVCMQVCVCLLVCTYISMFIDWCTWINVHQLNRDVQQDEMQSKLNNSKVCQPQMFTCEMLDCSIHLT